MRFAFIALAALALAGCRVPYTSDIANFGAFPEPVPPPGTSVIDLESWFYKRGYGPGPRVLQSEAELRRDPGEPLVYALQAEREWWLTQHRVVRDFCVTKKTIYYQLDGSNALTRAIQGRISQC
jgi:hypothetical protein